MSQAEHKPHKWDKEIRAFLDGKSIDWKNTRDLDRDKWHTASPTEVHLNWFANGAFIFRVTPEKKTPGQVYWETLHPDDAVPDRRAGIERAAKAVIEAYKNGELDYE